MEKEPFYDFESSDILVSSEAKLQLFIYCYMIMAVVFKVPLWIIILVEYSGIYLKKYLLSVVSL